MIKEQFLSLVQKASQGDLESFEMILNEKSRHILYNAYDILKNHHDAEDAAQDVVVKMYQNIGNLQKPENFNAWMHRIIHNVCISKLRKSKYYKHDLELDSVMDPSFSEALMEKDREFLPHTFIEDKSLSEMLLKVVRELPKRRRRAIILYYYEDLTQKEISEVMGISESTVASNILRAKDDIKKKLEAMTGLDLDSSISTTNEKTAQKLATIPVLGQVLRSDAVSQFGPESVAGLVNTDYQNVSKGEPKVNSNTGGLGIKIGAATLAMAMTLCGIFIAIDEGPDIEPESQIPTSISETEQSTGSALTEDGEIEFLEGDCDCGHENPSGAVLIYDEPDYSGSIDYVWELVDMNGSVVADGIGESIDIDVDNLGNGNYTARFILTDDNGNILTVERELEIK